MYEALFEDEDDIFSGSPKTKYFDILTNSSSEVAVDELDRAFERLAIFEMMMSEEKGEDYDLYAEIEKYKFNHSSEVENKKKSLYIEYTGNIVCRLDS